MDGSNDTHSLEAARLATLHALEILDTEPDPSLDRITALARTFFDVPIALISLVDTDRQWFKSAQGISVTETPRDWAFCSHAIRQSEVTVVEDARAHPEFAANPLVTGDMQIRFYAGAPLVMPDGAALGTLCIIDTEPRKLSGAECQKLSDLAAVVVDVLQSIQLRTSANQTARHAQQILKLEQDAARLGAIVERAQYELYVVDMTTYRFLFANAGSRRNLGYTLEEMKALSVSDINPHYTKEALDQLKYSLLQSQSGQIVVDTEHVRKTGDVYPCQVRIEIDDNGPVPVLLAFVTDTTEQQAQQEQLESYTALNQAILDSSEAGILSFSPIKADDGSVIDYKIVAANPANIRITGRTPEQLLGTTLLNEFPGTKTEGLYDVYHKVASTGEPAEFEVYYDHDAVKDWFQVSAVQTGEDGFTITFIPITEAKQHQIALRKLHDIANEADLDTDLLIKKILRLGRNTFGCKHGFYAQIHEDIYKLIALDGDVTCIGPGDSVPVSETLAATLIESKEPLYFNSLQNTPLVKQLSESKHGSGCYIGAPISINGKPVGTLSFADPECRKKPFTQANVDTIRVMADNIAAHLKLKDARDALRSSRDELQLLFDNMPARIWYKDDKNTILRANKTAAWSMGFDNPDDLNGADTYALFPEMAWKYYEDDLAVISSGQPLRNIIESFTPKDGEKGWVSADKIPMELSSGEKTLLVVATDITGLKEREEQLEHLNKSLHDFAVVAAHDLQAPLRQANMFLEILKDEIERSGPLLAQEGQDALLGASNSITHMRNLIRSVYNLYSLDTKQHELVPIDLNTVLQTALTRLEETLQSSNAEVDVAGLPTIPGAEALLVQLFQNILFNACKYAGNAVPAIRIYSLRVPEKLCHRIIFEDEGLGIPLESQEKVFEPFKRLYHDEEIEGVGIGLSLCRRIAHVHNGSLIIDPVYTKGARFFLDLPYY